MGKDPYAEGFQVAAREIAEGRASLAQAKERDLYPDNQAHRIEWDRGYAHAVCAYRLGHDVQGMARFEMYGASLQDEAATITALLDGKWELEMRADPRRAR